MLLTGLLGIFCRLKGGGDEGGKLCGLEKLRDGWPEEEYGRARMGDELPLAPFVGEPYAASERWMPGGPRA